MTFNDFLPILGSARGAHKGSNEPCFPVLKTLVGPNGPNTRPWAPQGSQRPQQNTPRVPQASKNYPATSISFDFVWCSDVIRQIIFARDSLAAFQASQDQTKIATVARSFQNIRVHISKAEHPEPLNTFARKRDNAWAGQTYMTWTDFRLFPAIPSMSHV
jgi:hypothetical protein